MLQRDINDCRSSSFLQVVYQHGKLLGFVLRSGDVEGETSGTVQLFAAIERPSYLGR